MPENSSANLAFLSLGSNIEPEQNLRAAVASLTHYGSIKAASRVWQTAPVGFADQPDFLNVAVLLETRLSALTLRESAIAEIEDQLGRVRTEDKNGPRTIDIDIMLFNDEILTVGPRRIPDKEILERAFVAIPLAEIAPDYVHPETGQRLSEIAEQFDASIKEMCPRADIDLSPTTASAAEYYE